MKVELLEYTPQSDVLAAAAAHSCHSNKGAKEIKETENEKKLKEILRKTVERGHTSVVEHANFTFSLEGISRACSHQLVRHRIASYSQQSQRYTKPDDIEYVTPPSINKEASARENFQKAMKMAWKAYENLMEKEDVPKEDSRFVLPNATKTNVVMTMNARSLLNFFELRTCLHAQWEIRAVANKMLSEVKKVAPVIFEDAGPPCKRNGVCPEKDPDCKFYEEYIQ